MVFNNFHQYLDIMTTQNIFQKIVLRYNVLILCWKISIVIRPAPIHLAAFVMFRKSHLTIIFFYTEIKIIKTIQSGYRSSNNCTNCSYLIVDNILKAFKKNLFSDIILLDYSKAFDLLNCELLTSILNFNGVIDGSLTFFKNYLRCISACIKNKILYNLLLVYLRSPYSVHFCSQSSALESVTALSIQVNIFMLMTSNYTHSLVTKECLCSTKM